MINWINKFLDLFFFLCVATSTDTLVRSSAKTRLEPNVPQGSRYKVAAWSYPVRLLFKLTLSTLLHEKAIYFSFRFGSFWTGSGGGRENRLRLPFYDFQMVGDTI